VGRRDDVRLRDERHGGGRAGTGAGAGGTGKADRFVTQAYTELKRTNATR
jgi:hypothetical protein